MTEKIIRGLLIEDDPDDTLLLMDLMATPEWPSFKFDFTCAETLQSGLDILSREEIEIILLDLMLPDSRGIETVRRIRAMAPGIPVVVMTGLSDETLGFEAIKCGAQDYQIKGAISGHALKRTIGFAVERHRLQANIRNIIRNAPDGMAVVDAKGVTRCLNAAAEAIFGRAAAEMKDKPFPYPIAAKEGRINVAAEDGGNTIVEMRVSNIEWEEAPARLVSLRDITGLLRVEELKAEVAEQRKMDKLKDELLSAISHEMRSPLTIIKATSSNLQEGLAGPLSEDQANMVSLQFKNVLRLEKVVDRTLDLSRLESGKAIIKARNMDAAALIRETLRGFRLVAAGRKVAFDQEVSHRLPPIYADSELFVQVLSNLLDNAMRFAKTRILTRAATAAAAAVKAAKPKNGGGGAEEYVQFSVIDDGPGIPRERLGDLFNKFVQVSREASSEGYKGTGLGLAICKEIVERQGGCIWAESAAGRGAQFHFLLPQYDPERAGARGKAYAARK